MANSEASVVENPIGDMGKVPTKVGLATLLMVVAGTVGVTLLIVSGAAFLLVRSGKISVGITARHGEAVARAEAPRPSHVVALDQMTVNLMDAGGTSFLRVAMSLRVADGKGINSKKGEASDKAPKGTQDAALRDTILAVLGRETSAMLLEADGKSRLKVDLRKALASNNTDVSVSEIYLTEFLVQP